MDCQEQEKGNEMEEFKTISDVGCIKVYNSGLSCYFSNNSGDGINKVYIVSEVINPETKKFVGSFDVRKNAYLSSSDCSYEPIYKFKKGRWFVFLTSPGVFEITKIDENA